MLGSAFQAKLQLWTKFYIIVSHIPENKIFFVRHQLFLKLRELPRKLAGGSGTSTASLPPWKVFDFGVF